MLMKTRRKCRAARRKGKEEAINAPKAPMDSDDSKVDDRAQQMGRGLAYLREIDPGFDEAGFPRRCGARL